MVIVPGLSAHVDHAVDGRTTAEDASPRIAKRPAVQARRGVGGEAPIGARITHAKEIADGDVNPDVVVLAAGFQEGDGVGRVFRQPVGKDAPGGAGADDDEIE